MELDKTAPLPLQPIAEAVVSDRSVRSVRSDRTPQTHRTVRTGCLFAGFKSDLLAFVGNLLFAVQQPFALKGSQCPQCLAALLEAVAMLITSLPSTMDTVPAVLVDPQARHLVELLNTCNNSARILLLLRLTSRGHQGLY